MTPKVAAFSIDDARMPVALSDAQRVLAGAAWFTDEKRAKALGIKKPANLIRPEIEWATHDHLTLRWLIQYGSALAYLVTGDQNALHQVIEIFNINRLRIPFNNDGRLLMLDRAKNSKFDFTSESDKILSYRKLLSAMWDNDYANGDEPRWTIGKRPDWYEPRRR